MQEFWALTISLIRPVTNANGQLADKPSQMARARAALRELLPEQQVALWLFDSPAEAQAAAQAKGWKQAPTRVAGLNLKTEVVHGYRVLVLPKPRPPRKPRAISLRPSKGGNNASNPD